MDNGVKYFISSAILAALIFSLLSAAAGFAAINEAEIIKKLNRNYEKNADEVMAWIKEEKFDDAEDFINYVVEHNSLTRDGIRYFRAMLEHWFTSREVAEFRYQPPVPQDILPYIENWIKYNPKSANAHIIRGVYHIERAWEIRGGTVAKDVSEEKWKPFREYNYIAKQELETAYGLDPKNPHSSRQLMRVQRALNSRDKDATEIYFLRATKNHPTFYWAYDSKITNLMPKWGGDWKTMFAFANETAKNAPPGSLLKMVLSRAIVEVAMRSEDPQEFLRKENVWNKLEGIYKEIIDDYPKSSRWKVRLAQIAIYAGMLEKAEAYLNLAEETDPTDGRIYMLKTFIADSRKNLVMMEQNASLAIKYFPEHLWLYEVLGESLCRGNRLNEAVDVYSKMIEIRPDVSFGWGMRCTLDKRLERHDEAIFDCTKAMELDRDNYYYFKLRGYAYEQIGDLKAAEADYQEYNRRYEAYKSRKKQGG